MMKSLRFMLLSLLTLVCGTVLATDVTWTVTETSGTVPEIKVDDNITLTFAIGNGDTSPKYSTYGTKTPAPVVNLGANNTVNVAAANNATITKVVFTFKGDNYSISTCDASGKTSTMSTTGITTNGIDNTATWTGETTSIYFGSSSRRYISSIAVTYKAEGEVVEQKADMTFGSTYVPDKVDLTSPSNFTVYVKNNGDAVANNVQVHVFVDGSENNVITKGDVNVGATAWISNTAFDVTNITAGDHEVYLTVTADNDNAESTLAKQTTTKTVNFYTPVVNPAFSIAAATVTVPYNAESYDVVATLKEINGVAATDVKVELRSGISTVLATQTVAALDANGETQVTLNVAKELFGTGNQTYNLYVNDKFLTSVAVTFEEAPVVEVKDLAITEVLGTLDLANTTNNVRVSVVNNGNVDINDAVVTLKAGEQVLGTATVSAAAGQTAFCFIAVASEGLEAGELDVVATVEVEGDATPADNTMAAKLTVNAAPAPEATLVLTAQNVEFNVGEDISFTVNVKNNSEVEAKDVTVQILYGTTVLAQSDLSYNLAPGEAVDVPFTIEKDMQIPAGTFDLQAVAGKFSCFFTVTVKEVVVPVIDIALVDISGISEISLKEGAVNTAIVRFNNNSNVDVENATITLKMNGTEVGTETIAKGQASVSFALPTEGLEVGQEVTLVATLNVENNVEGNTAEVSKTLPVVSGEAAPAPVITLNPVSSWEVETAGEQTINVSVGVFNTGNADAEVTVKVYKDFGTYLDSKTVTVEKENGSAIASLSFTYDIQQATTFHVVAYIGNTPVTEAENFTVSVKQQVAELGLAKIADIKATTEEDVKIAAVVKNNSTIDAAEVKVGLYTQGEDYQYQLVGLQQTIEAIAAGETANVEFNLGKLAAGTYKYYVRIVTQDDYMDNNFQDVNVTVTEPVAPVVNVALTAIQGISNIDLAAEANTISVWAENAGNVEAQASIAVTLNGTAVGEAQAVTIAAGRNAYATFTLPTEGLTAGEKATVVATVTVADNTAETTTITREYDIVDSSVATEPVFTVAAENVTVPFGAESFEIKATVKNTSEIAANGLTVKLLKGITEVETKTLNIVLAAGEETEVTFTIAATEEAPFVAGTTDTYYVQVPKAQAEVTVTFAEKSVDPVYDLAITEVIGTISLAAETSTVRVTVQNNGNQDITDAAVELKAGETVLGTATVSAKAGQQGWCQVAVATASLEAGELAVVATVTVENDATPADNIMEATLTVQAAPVAEPAFEVTAADVTVPFGATSFEIKATVKNTSEVAANGLTVKLLKGITEVETKTLNVVLGAGEETEVTFTIAATEEAPFIAGTTANYFVQVENKAQAEVNVTFAEKPAEQVVDLAITSISGSLSLEVETNYLSVFVENKGTVDVNGATVTLKAGDAELGTATVSAKVGDTGFCSIAVPATALTAGEFTVVATVTVEGDVDVTNNTMEKTYTIAAPAPELSFTVEAKTQVNATTLPVNVTVKNSEKAAAENISVTVYDANSNKLGEATIESLAAGAETKVTINVEKTYTEEGTMKNELQVTVSGVEGVKWVDVTVEHTAVGIAAIKAQYGEDAQVYTISGQKVNTVAKGLYIVNGKKVIVK